MSQGRRMRTIAVVALLSALAGLLAWRSLRPMNIFVVSEAFERPIDTRATTAPLAALRAADCGVCHPAVLQEWQTTMQSRAWTDPYFQVDWVVDGRQQI